MRKYVKSIVIILLIFIMVFSLIACNQAPMVSMEQLLQEIESGVVEGEITFTYSYAASSKANEQAIERYINAFEKKYKDVKVNRDYTVTSDARISSGDIGDVFYFPEVDTYKYAVKDQALIPLDGFIEKFGINQSDVYSGIYALGLVNGRLYFVARDYNQMGMIYNKSAITQAGLSESIHKDWSWYDFLNICEQLYDPNGDYYPACVYLHYSPVYTAFFDAYTQRNSWISKSDNKITFIDEQGEILKAVSECIDAARKGHIFIPGVNDSDFKGKQAIISTTVYPTIVDSLGKAFDNAGIDWDMINMPLFKNPSFGCGASGVGVFSRTRNVTAAAALALFFFTPEGQKSFNSGMGGSVPLLKSIDEEGFNEWKFPNDAWSEKNWDAWVYLADTASVPGQVNCRMPIEIAEIIDKSIISILKNDLLGDQSYQDGFKELEIKCNEAWKTLK